MTAQAGRDRHTTHDDAGFGEPLGPWTYQHTLGATVVILIMLGLAANIWPGWQRLANLMS